MVSALTCEQLKMKLDTSVAVWLPAIPSRCRSVSPSTALTQPLTGKYLYQSVAQSRPDFAELAWKTSISVSTNCRAGLLVL